VRQESAKPRSRDSKQTRVIEMLQRQQGATIAAITPNPARIIP
jgi:hypothetical protein